MGGPCLVDDGGGRRRAAPPCTDNFQLCPIEFNGRTFHSVEQAYQAAKLDDPTERKKVEALRPRPKESASAFGMRCWQQGQIGRLVADWDRLKVDVMYRINRAKYEQHLELQSELLATGNAPMVGGPSTAWTHNGQRHDWSCWNGRIQMRIREELRILQMHVREGDGGVSGSAQDDGKTPPQPNGEVAGESGSPDNPVLSQLVAHFDVYLGVHQRSDTAHDMSGWAGSRSLQAHLSQLMAAGLEFPYVCPACNFRNESFPQLCEVCEMTNPQYVEVTSRIQVCGEAGVMERSDLPASTPAPM